MRTITLEQASADLPNIVQRTLQEHSETVIASQKGAVIMVDETEWQNIKETLKLLNDKDAIASLLKSHSARDKREKPEGITFEEAFKDVQNSNT